MAPLRLLLMIVLVTLLTAAVYSVLALFWHMNNEFYRAVTGRNWTWSELPEPFGSVLRNLYETVAPNLFLASLVLALIFEFVTMFRHTTEGYEHEV